jgi:hypothetical protein
MPWVAPVGHYHLTLETGLVSLLPGRCNANESGGGRNAKPNAGTVLVRLESDIESGRRWLSAHLTLRKFTNARRAPDDSLFENRRVNEEHSSLHLLRILTTTRGDKGRKLDGFRQSEQA